MLTNNQVIGYNDSFWRLEKEFKYTGTDQSFALSPGKYLFVCHGAPGGTNTANNVNGGGTSYGIIDLDSSKTFHAVVGGNGKNTNLNYALTTGGFNGGAHGGLSYSSAYNSGAGGGGASDIRLLPYDPDEYPTYDTTGNVIPPVKDKQIYYDAEYDESSPSDQHTYYALEYIRSTNRSYPINTGFIFNSNYHIEIDVTLHGNGGTGYQAIIGTANESNITANPYMALFLNYNNTDEACIIRMKNDGTIINESLSDDSIMKNERTVISLSHNKIQQMLNGRVIYEFEYGGSSISWKEPLSESVYINSSHGLNGHTYNSEDSTVMQLYSFKGYNNNDELINHLVPVIRVSDNSVGLFDIITNTFKTPTSTDTSAWWDPGPFIINTPSLNSRVIVAGGGGGSPCWNSESKEKCISGFGGGTCGGPVNGNTNGQSYAFFSTQTQGYSFGFGQYPTKRPTADSYSTGGAGGGGGGWFGGFASIDKKGMVGLSASGGGGSGYVLTSSSYKPVGYTPTSDYYFTNTCMTSHTSFESKICVYKLTSLKIGDVITFPPVGKQEHIKIPAGEYVFECYGGSGGIRYDGANCSKGGYAKGTFTTSIPRETYVNVGGCGGPLVWLLDHDGKTYDQTHTNSTLVSQSYNGGRIPQAHYTGLTKSGGGTDIRIDDDSLYNRIIVAGGAGSEGRHGYHGGDGGGTTGGSYSNGMGNNNGPGTQTSSPNSTNPSVAGEFGIGGLGTEPTSSISKIRSGSGGGGWFGGSGTGYNGYTTDSQKSGSGGSGYVLTDSSYIIEGYQLDPTNDALTDTQLVTGGNTLNPFETKAVITVNSIDFKCLCRDRDGIKYFDDIEQSWVLTPTQVMSVELFSEYGSKFINDNGLSNNYTLHIYDEDESITKFILDVIPNKQTVDINTELSLNISSMNIDDREYNPSDYKIDCVSIKKHDETTGEMVTHLKLSIDQLTSDAYMYRGYGVIILYTNNEKPHDYVKLDDTGKHRVFNHYITTNSDNHEIIIEERTMELGDPEDYRNPITGEITVHQSLLKVGQNNKIPLKYLNVLEPDSTNVYAGIMAERDRVLYLLQTFNTSSNIQMTIKALNIQTGMVTTILRIPVSSFYPSNRSPVAGFLVDDNYFYLSIYADNNGNNDYRKRLTKINISTGQISRTSLSPYIIHYNAGGHLEWYDDHRILVMSNSGYGTHMMLYDTMTDTWETIQLENTSFNTYRWTLGSKYVIVSNDTSSDFVKVFNKNTGELVWTSPEKLQYPSFAYNDGKFYIVNRTAKFYILDEETLELSDQILVSTIKFASFVKYVNGALYITQQNQSSNKLVVYRLNEQTHLIIYTPWTSYNDKSTWNSFFEPFEINGVFYYSINTLLVSDYSGYSKYKFGKKFNQYNISFANDNVDNMKYDERFITVDEAGLYTHSGSIEYPLSQYDSNHIASCDITKLDYKFILNANVSEY